MMSAAEYRIIGIDTKASAPIRHVGSPRDGYLLSTAKKRSFRFIIRYWPSKKGWRILDARNAVCTSLRTAQGDNVARWIDYKWSEKIYPSEDAAVVAAIYIS